MKRTIAVLAAATLAMSGLAACGGDKKENSSAEAAVPGADVLTNAKEKTTVEFWHSMTGANEKAIQELATGFNAKFSGKAEIKPVFQGKYDETITKYKTSVQQKKTPPLVMIYDIGSRYMLDAKQVVPMYKFVEKDGYPLADIEPNIANYYTVDGKLQSMPFNSSTPLLYINKEAFTKAGLDPEKPPRTLDEIAAAAEKLTVKDGGKTTQYGFGAALYGWLIEQLIATSGKEYCNEGNGRKGLATKVQFDSPAGVKIAQWWTDLVKKGHAINTGRKVDDGQAAFKAGNVAMHLESTSVLKGYVDATKGKFTVATAPYPKLDANANSGTIIGGASLWIGGAGHSDLEKRISWEFVKWATMPEQQAKWHVGTGYVPVNKKALDDPADKAWVAKFPQFNSAVTQLHENQPSVATAGCLLGVMPQSRQASEEGLETAVLGTKSPEQAMKDAAAKLQSDIDKYNKSVSK